MKKSTLLRMVKPVKDTGVKYIDVTHYVKQQSTQVTMAKQPKYTNLNF